MIEQTYRRCAVLVAFAAMSFIGCGPRTYQPDPFLISQYRAPGVPTQDETFVYVIRARGAVGSARGVWIAVNDRVVGELDNGTHLLLKLKSGVNTVHCVQNLALLTREWA